MTKLFTRGAMASALIAAFAAPAFAQDSTQTAVDEIGLPLSLFQGAPKLTDDEGNTLKLRGRMFFDVASLEETSGGVTTEIDGNEFRAFRLGAEGQYGDVKFKGEVDFAGSEVVVKDLIVTYNALPVDISVGQMKTPNSLDEITSARHTTFMERGAFTDAFGLDRRLGVLLTKKGENFTLEGGVFRNSIESFNNDETANTVWAARGVYLPVSEKDQLIHLGASWRYVEKQNDAAPGRSSRWGAHLANEKVRPLIGEEATLWGLEAATVQGSLHAQAEYMSEKGELGEANGYFVQAGYFLTGESRGYKGNKFDRTKPSAPLSKGGMGAWEIAARYDVIDATDAGDEESTAQTIGLIWYPESHLRFKLEYINADADTYEASGIQFRTQVDW